MQCNASMESAQPISCASFLDEKTFYKIPNNKHVRISMSSFLRPNVTPHANSTSASAVKVKLDISGLSDTILLNDANADSFTSLVQTCTDIKQLQQLHVHMLKSGLHENIKIVTSLISKYTLCGSMANARLLFDNHCQRDVFLWNTMIDGYVRNGLWEDALVLYYQMQTADIQPGKYTFPFVLKACAGLSSLQLGMDIHDDIVRTGLESDIFVGTSLVAMYAKCGSIELARQVFDNMSTRNVVSWNAMIAGYAQIGHVNETLTLFHQMQLLHTNPNSVTMCSVLRTCVQVSALQLGRQMHGYIISTGFESNVFVGTALIDMYAKCGSLECARKAFDKMSTKDVVAWNTMIAVYEQNGHANEALILFNEMQRQDIKPDLVTMASTLTVCAHLSALQHGKVIHGYIIKSGFNSDVVDTALIHMYTKCGHIDFAHQLFDTMPSRDVVSWSAMIAGYAQNGHASEALALFNKMQLQDIKPDLVTVVSILPACAHLAALQQGKRIHSFVLRHGFESDVVVATALIDMYAKCGSIEIARQLFDKISERNVVLWNAMIAGYGMHGHGKDALEMFSQMQQIGMVPDHITFIGVLSACSHAGLVDEGWQYFDSMSRDYCITPKAEHYACLVDLLGRAGHLDEAHDFIKRMPLEADAVVWGALLGACRIHCNTKLGEHVAERLFILEPQNAGRYVLLSNIYAAAGRWVDVARVRTMMKERGLKKEPGCSLIEVNNTVHAFHVGDRSHPQSEKIYAMLATLAGLLKEAGYVPNKNFVLHDVEEEVKEWMLCSHSEKLAIAFGLINTSTGTPIRIVKNLRICDDCHSATKFISKIVRREIIVRDANCFHHFKGGLCSCADYW
eukprot:Gb_21580 [translate_table: standard]